MLGRKKSKRKRDRVSHCICIYRRAGVAHTKKKKRRKSMCIQRRKRSMGLKNKGACVSSLLFTKLIVIRVVISFSLYMVFCVSFVVGT